MLSTTLVFLYGKWPYLRNIIPDLLNNWCQSSDLQLVVFTAAPVTWTSGWSFYTSTKSFWGTISIRRRSPTNVSHLSQAHVIEIQKITAVLRCHTFLNVFSQRLKASLPNGAVWKLHQRVKGNVHNYRIIESYHRIIEWISFDGTF